MKRVFYLAILAALLVSFFSSCTPRGDTQTESYQATVDAVSELLQPIRYETPDDTQMLFEASSLLTFLPHLSMESGYTLDYVYMRYSVGSHPILYAKPSGQSAEAIEADQIETLSNYPESRFWYLDHIHVDDTPAGYFEFAMLRIMGDQFYLGWHSAYNDETIVCSQAAIDRLLSSMRDDGFGSPSLSEVSQRARDFNPVPVIKLEEDTVSVSLVVFTQWGGFLRRKYTITRDCPHQLLNEQVETLVEYDCGEVF